MSHEFEGLEFPPFGGLTAEFSNPATAKVHVLPVPYERTSSWIRGSVNGPSRILQASCNMELYDDELRISPYTIGMHTLPAFRPRGETPEAAVAELEVHFQEVLQRAPFLGMISSEHTVTGPMVRAMASRFPGLTVLQIDAHSDLRDTYDGTKYSHACAMRRVVEVSPLVAVGVRSLSPEEAEALPHLPVRTFWAREIVGMPGISWIPRVLDAIPDRAPLYVTIDMDGFDPSVVPAVGTPEPGGLGWYETLALLREVCRERQVVGFDILEMCPREGDEVSAFIAARLFYKIVGYVFSA